MGTEIKGDATIVRGNFIDYRTSKSSPVGYIQTNISLVEGMSGGPLVDQCGSLVGVNTMGLAGLSLFIGATDGFNLLSKKYLEKTNFEEWTNRFTNTAFVKFSTQNWVDGELEWHYYEGTWKTVKEDGIYKMLQSKIKEVFEPGWDWFYD